MTAFEVAGLYDELLRRLFPIARDGHLDFGPARSVSPVDSAAALEHGVVFREYLMETFVDYSLRAESVDPGLRLHVGLSRSGRDQYVPHAVRTHIEEAGLDVVERSMSPRYSVLDGELLITTTHDHDPLWAGMPDGQRVEAAWPLPGTSDGLVLLEHMSRPHGAFRNLLRVDPRGSIVWRADLPSSGNDAYVAADVQPDGSVTARSWSAYLVHVAPATGRLLRSEFVK